VSSTERRGVRVLVVDDSALVREVLQRVLGRDGSLSVLTAADPLIAARKIEASRPDVILLDLAMPRMDGLSFLRKLMAEDPVPVVVCSAMTDGAELVMRALHEGAVDVVKKPVLGVRGFLEDSVTTLVDAVHAAAQARVLRRGIPRLPTATPQTPHHATARPASPRPETLVAVGASTGGTEALAVVLGALPTDAPGLVVVQHMPEGFTDSFARRLDAASRVSVKQAADGDRVEPGRVLIAPGDRHVVVQRESGEWRVRIVDGPLVARHRPSVDVLFRSVAAAAGPSAVGVILTGMGRDGAEGLRAMKDAGARTLAQDEATCVVFGMPKEAIARGAVDRVLPLPRIAQAILEQAPPARQKEAR